MKYKTGKYYIPDPNCEFCEGSGNTYDFSGNIDPLIPCDCVEEDEGPDPDKEREEERDRVRGLIG